MGKVSKYLIVVIMSITSQIAQASTFSTEFLEQYNQDVQNILSKSKILYSRADIERETSRVADEINSELKDKNPIILSALIGGMMYT